MTIREQLTDEQWKKVFNGPFAAAAFAATASGGSIELIKELFSATRFMAETAQGEVSPSYGPLVDELLTIMKGMSSEEARGLRPDITSREPEGMRSELKAMVMEAAGLVRDLPGAEGYRRWLLDSARRAVEASRGGFLGIGASKQPVDDKEQQALNQLNLLLHQA